MPTAHQDREPAMWSIRNVNDHGLAWSNTHGWVEDDDYDLFTPDEKQSMNLPIDGDWFGIW